MESRGGAVEAEPRSAEVGPGEIRSPEELGAWLSAARARAGLTVRELAKLSDIPTSTVGGYLTGRHVPPASRPEVLFAMLAALGVDAGEPEPWRQMLWRLSQTRRPRGVDEAGPYQGLLPFDEQSARYYFGREDEVRDLAELVEAVLPHPTTQGTPLVLVVGASGSGKSSLVRAGLVPALGDEWYVETVRPGNDPHSTFSAARSAVAREHGNTKRLVVLDQLEELWTRSEEGAGAAALGVLLDPPLPDTVIVATLRADFYGQATEHPALAQALRDRQIVVEPMSDADLARTITGPADVAGIELASGLVDRIVADATTYSSGDRGTVSLPHLSHCLRQMWERRERNSFTHPLYEQVGGIGGALSSTAERIFASLDPHDQSAAKRLLLRLVVVEEGVTPIAGDLPVEAVSRDPERRIADQLAGERLVVIDDRVVRLSHEALLTAWPRMALWIDEDRAILKTTRVVEREAGEWRASSEDPDLLLRGARLEAAAELDDEGSLLSPSGRRFITASRQAADAEKTDARKRARRVRRLLIATSALAVAALVGSAGLIVTAQRLSQARDEAKSRQLAAQSRELVDVDPVISEQLALAAYATSDTVESRSAVLDAAARPATLNLNGPTGVRFVGAAPRAHLMATAGEGKGVIVYDTSARVPRRLAEVPAPLDGKPGSSIFAVALSDDGRWLAAGGTAGMMRVWDVSRPAAPLLVADSLEVGGTINDIVFDTSAGVVYAGSSETGVRRWRLASRPEELPRIPVRGTVSALAKLSDGRIAVGTAEGGISVWDPADPSRPAVSRQVGERQVTGIAESKAALAVSSRDPKAMLIPWDPRRSTLGEPQTVDSFSNWVNDVAVSPEAGLTVFGSSEKVVTVADKAGVVRERIPVADNVTSVSFVAARRIVIGLVNGQTIVRDLPPYAGNGTFGSVYGTGWARDRNVAVLPAFGPEGSLDASVWDVSDPAQPRELSRITKGSAEGRSAAVGDISPDGRTVVIATDAGWLDGFDVSDPTRPTERFAFRLTDPAIEQVSFVADDTFLIPSDDSHVRMLRLERTGRPTLVHDLSGAEGLLLLNSASRDLSVVAAGSTTGSVYLWQPESSDQPVAEIPGQGYAYAVALTPDGTQLAVSGTDRSVRIYDVTAPTHPRLLTTLTGTTGTTFTLEYDKAGGRLLGTVNDGSLVIWSRTGGDYEREVVLRRGTPLYNGSWAPDGNHVIAGGSKGFARIVPTSPGEAKAQLCATIGEWLTPDRWSASLPLEDVRDPCP